MAKRLTEASVRKAISDAAAGQSYDVSDAGAPGLVLRVAPRGATWAFRSSIYGRPIRLRLGAVNLFGLTVARDLAAKAMLMVRERSGTVNASWLQYELVSRRIIEPPPPEPRPEPALKPLPRWTYRQAMDAYLAEVQETLRPATYRDRRSMLKIAEMTPFFDRPVASITRQELASVVAAIAKTRERHAKHLCEVLRPMWTWLAEDDQQLQSGILGTPMATLKPPKKRRVTIEQAEAKTTYLPPVPELGRIMAMAQAQVMGEVMSDAALLTLYTAQRRLTIVQARRKDFAEEEGDLIWKIPQAYMKSGDHKQQPHELPLPAGAAAIVQRRLAIETESTWLFPGERVGRSGVVGHLSPDSLTHGFAALPGTVCAPHDVRRTFPTYLEDVCRIPLTTLKIVLDHSEGFRSDVTNTHYSRARRLDQKREILEPWAAALEEAAAAVDLGDVAALREQFLDVRREQEAARLAARVAAGLPKWKPRKKTAA